jgi:predicted amidohydrolase
MTEGQGDQEGEELVERLREAGNEMTAVIALLWTWLEGRLLDLGSLREKPSAIRSRALAAPGFEGVDEDVLEWVAEFPLRNAAELLARIECRYGDASSGLASASVGFDGTPVVVAWRRSDLARRAGGRDYPPASDEQPSLSTLAPSLLVCPGAIAEIALHVLRPAGPEWELARQKLETGMVEGEPTLEVHLDSLGEAGRSDWWVDSEFDVGALREEDVLPEQRAEVLKAVRSAVREAAGPSRILVLPELVATDDVLATIGEELRSLRRAAPALTVVGRYHQLCEDVADHPDQGRYFNEAVVLGPLGGILWRHRKLSSAADDVDTEDGSRKIVEDIRLGRSLDVVDSPLGSLAVAICLDTFADHSRERLARSPANVLLVPSLSQKVARHRTSLWHLVQVLFGIAFVCNRAVKPLDGKSGWDDDQNRSFWAIQRTPLEVPVPSEGERPSFVFRLSAAD